MARLLRDCDIRDQLRVTARSHVTDLLVDEMVICAGTARIDLAVINGDIRGFEIKSDRDDLSRLPAQVEAYDRVCDLATAVVTDRHLDAAMDRLPPHWGLTVAAALDDSVTLTELRTAALNPSLDADGLAQLLWRDEVLTILDAYGAVRGHRSKPRYLLWEILAAAVPCDELRDAVREALKARTSWRADRSPSAGDALARQ